jgi:hypothetical protein
MNRACWIRHILSQRKARVVHPTLIEEINDAVRPNAPRHDGNRVDDQANAILGPRAFRDLLLQLLVRCCQLVGFGFGVVQLRGLDDVAFRLRLRHDGGRLSVEQASVKVEPSCSHRATYHRQGSGVLDPQQCPGVNYDTGPFKRASAKSESADCTKLRTGRK